MPELELYIGDKKKEGILTRFINRKYKTYVEPTKKGTPKGEPIGFSKKKYLATLLALTSLPLKEQAQESEVSYGLLRKWRSGKKFNAVVDEHIKDFFIDYENAFIKSDMVGRLMKDLMLYGNRLLFDLTEMLLLLHKNADPMTRLKIGSCLDFFMLQGGSKSLKKTAVKTFCIKHLGFVVAMLSENNISESDRKACVGILEIIQKILAQI